jgi:putative spermidine/putrescine transport system ATP-binding protein
MVRPESIRVVDAGSSGLAGTIDSVSFNGDRQRLVVSGAADKPLAIEVSNTVQAKAGERVGLSIAPEAVRLLPLEHL